MSKASTGAIVLLTFILNAGMCIAVLLGEKSTDGCPDNMKGRIVLRSGQEGDSRHIQCCKIQNMAVNGVFKMACALNPELMDMPFEDVDDSECGSGDEDYDGEARMGCSARVDDSNYHKYGDGGCERSSACTTEEAEIKKEKEAEIKREQERMEKAKRDQQEAQAAELERLKKEEGEEAARKEALRLKEEKDDWLQANCKPYSDIECSAWSAVNMNSKYGNSNNGCPDGPVDCNTKKEVNSKFLCTCVEAGKCYGGESKVDAMMCLDPEDFFIAKGPAHA